MPIFNDRSKKEFRKALRNEPTFAERALWNGLRGNGIGAKFRRQESIGNYVVDFYCPEVRLAVEVDGASHSEREEYDARRDQHLAEVKVTTLRFSDAEVLYSSEKVLTSIRETVERMRVEGKAVRSTPQREAIK
jgi:very-short-patch-repair endonuclease